MAAVVVRTLPPVMHRPVPARTSDSTLPGALTVTPSGPLSGRFDADRLPMPRAKSHARSMPSAIRNGASNLPSK